MIWKPSRRGLLLTAAHCGLIAGIAGKYAWDRFRLPRAWARTFPVDPWSPLRGRYISLTVEVHPAPGLLPPRAFPIPVSLKVRNNQLVATQDPRASLYAFTRAVPGQQARLTLREPVQFFISEDIEDPSRRASGEELWVELSVPPKGPPRPIRLAVRRNGELLPLPLR